MFILAFIPCCVHIKVPVPKTAGRAGMLGFSLMTKALGFAIVKSRSRNDLATEAGALGVDRVNSR